jgi:RNA polymerase sigma-70 factor (ECF subfamily)
MSNPEHRGQSGRTGTMERGQVGCDHPEFPALLRDGDSGAYRRLIRRFHGALVGVAAAIIGSRAQAEEVVQEAWLSVFVGIDRFEGRSSLATWLYAIVRNGARSRAMRERRFAPLPTFELAEEQEWASSVHGPARSDGGAETGRLRDNLDPERVLAGRQEWAQAQVAIELLPARQKAVIVMCDVEAHGGEQACAALSISPGNKRVLLHRARGRVRQAIQSGPDTEVASSPAASGRQRMAIRRGEVPDAAAGAHPLRILGRDRQQS